MIKVGDFVKAKGEPIEGTFPIKLNDPKLAEFYNTKFKVLRLDNGWTQSSIIVEHNRSFLLEMPVGYGRQYYKDLRGCLYLNTDFYPYKTDISI